MKGDILKLGRIKFKVKDFRTHLEPAADDGSPTKDQRKQNFWEELGQSDDLSEEAVEIDLGARGDVAAMEG